LRQNNGSHSQQIIHHCVEHRPRQKLWHYLKQIFTQAINIYWFFDSQHVLVCYRVRDTSTQQRIRERPCSHLVYQPWSNAASRVSGRDAGDASAPLKFLICRKSGQNPLKFGQNLWQSWQKLRPTLFDFRKWRPTLAEEKWRAFLEITPRNLFCGRGQICRTKVAEQLFRQVWRNWAKIPSHPQKFAFSYTCERSYLSILSVLMQWSTVMFVRCTSSVEKQINTLAKFFKHELQ